MDTAGTRRRTGTIAARARTAALLCAAAALAVTSVPVAHATGPGPVSAPAPAPAPLVVVDCFEEPQVRPAEYLLACGDGNNRLVGLRWHTWGPATATATGTDMVNDCRPYCAAGRFRPYPVQVTLSRPQPWPDRPGTHRFTVIRLVYPEAAPEPVSHDVTYKLVY
ncbi:hypothetical protein HYE82_13455 [Streptomyces sp. BR123]|uniref:hypothetical protein n=1 Tax=Streptomyces sp. BR123 TaxID=2749828 RepID=UPI0015C4262A|nr:hypothetical protein [Streptomyces sp. BR123]NXY95375.1 hypothetical protein [Streptomyces sp. BR123]